MSSATTQQAGLRQNAASDGELLSYLDEQLETDPINTLCVILANALKAARTYPPRSYRQWFEDVVTIPDGKHAGERFRVSTQPIVGLWMDAIDSGHWNEFVFTAPSQFGKTLIAFIGPLLFHTCEVQENYVLGVPMAEMASDKWDMDVLPVLRASHHLKSLRPTSGSGSAGGKVRERITLGNGVEIKLMSAGGDDVNKAGFTGRVLGVTEAARFSTAGESSVEADPLRQLRARQRQWDESERTTYIEGTVTVEDELPWALKKQSTDSRIACQCPHCKEYVTPERDDIHGWQAATSDREAQRLAYWACPECGKQITEKQRRKMVIGAKLLHGEQKITPAGKIHGDLPDTSRLFFRASAFHNLFLSVGSIGKDEWLAQQVAEDSHERVSADRQLCQFVHCIPYVDPRMTEDLELDRKSISKQQRPWPATLLPADTEWLTAGVDVGSRQCWYSVLATRGDDPKLATYHVPMYGCVDVPSHKLPIDQAIQVALTEIHGILSAGLAMEGGRIRLLDQIWYDCGYKPKPVQAFLKAAMKEVLDERGYTTKHHKYSPVIGAYGRGETSISKVRYTHKRKTGNIVRDIDPSGLWYLERMAKTKVFATFWDADTSKWEWQHGLMIPLNTKDEETGEIVQTPGSITLYAGTSKTHERIARHWTNEKLETVHTVIGDRRRWVRRGANHLLDTAAMARRALDRAKHIATMMPYSKPFLESRDSPKKSSSGKPAKASRKWYSDSQR